MAFWDDFKKNVFKAVDDLTWWDNEPKKTTQAAPQQPVVAAPQKPVTIAKPTSLTSPLEMPGIRTLENRNMTPNTTPQTLLAKPTGGTIQDKMRLVSTQPTASPTVDVNKLNELKTKAQTYQNAGVQDVNNYYGTDLKGLNEAIARGDTKQAEGLMRSLDNRRSELKRFHDERGKSQTFKSARELEKTIKETRGDWSSQRAKLKQFWDTVGQNEAQDFADYMADLSGKPRTKLNKPGQLQNPNQDINGLMLNNGMNPVNKDSWKYGGTMAFNGKGADFSGDAKKVADVRDKQRGIDKLIKEYGDYGIEVGDEGQTINSFMSDFKNADAGKQRDYVKKLEKYVNDFGGFTVNADQSRKAQQAAILLEVINDRVEKKSDFGTKMGDVGDFVGSLGKGIISPFEKLNQADEVWKSGQVIGLNNKTDSHISDDAMSGAYNKAKQQHDDGKLGDKEFNELADQYAAWVNQYNRDRGWVGDGSGGVGDAALRSLGVAADVTGTVVPFLSVGKGYTVAKVAAEGGEQSLKKALTTQILKNSTENAGWSAAGAFREGTDTKLENVLTETGVGAGIGTVATGGGAALKGGKDQIVKILGKNSDVLPDSPSVFQMVNPETGEKFYKPLVPTEPTTPTVKITDRPGSSTQSIGAILTDFKARMEARAAQQVQNPITKVSEQAKKYGVQEDTINRMYAKWGEAKVDNILARSSDATNIRDMDAFVYSEAKKAYGNGNVAIKSDTPVENPTQGLPDKVKISSKNIEPEEFYQNDIDKVYKNHRNEKLDQDPYRNKARIIDKYFNELDPETQRYLEFEASGTNFEDASNSSYRGFDGSDSSNIHGSQIYELEQKVIAIRDGNAPKEAITDIPETPLGNMADDFYQSKTGNQRIKYRDLDNLGRNISKQVNADFKAINSDYSTVARKVVEFNRQYIAEHGEDAFKAAIKDGTVNLDVTGISPAEAGILRKAQAEMNYVRRRASLGKREVSGGGYGEMYIPEQKVGAYEGDQLFEGFRAEKPGNEFKRGNKIELEDLDYSPDVIGQYVTRYGDTKLLSEERLYRALAKHNEGVPEETIRDAAQKMIEVQNKVNSVKTKISAFGAGIRKQIDESGKFVDSAKEITEVGRTLGHDIETLVDEGHGLTNGDRINSVTIGDETLGDRLGLNQWRDAGNYSSSQVQAANGDRAVLADSVRQRLQNDYNLTPEDIEYAVGGISRMADNLPDEVVLSRVQSTYKNAAKQQLLEELQHLDIKNPKLRKDVSSLTNQILREGSIESELSEKLTRGILRTQNALFRKLNVSSALNELSDLNSFLSVYGRNTALKPDFGTIKEFGLGDIDAAIEPYVRQLDEGAKVSDVLKSINSKTNLYKFVEHYKAAVVGTSAKNTYAAKGITGDALTKAVLDDYRQLALPVDAFTKTFLDNAPLYTQYMTWGVRNLQKEARLATGKIDAGKLGDMTTGQRIARNAYANLPAKTVFWLTSNGLKGTGILTAFGLTDFTGMSSGDYSGIQDEDKSLFDKTTQLTNQSTTLSLLNTIIQSWEKEQLKNSDKYKDADYNPYANNALDEDIINNYTPQFIKNIVGATDMNTKGYSDNNDNFAREVKDSLGITQDDGRVQYEAPTDFYNIAKSYLFGKSQTDNAREYSGNKNLAQRLGEGTDVVTAITDMAKEQINVQDKNYTRPLTDDYSKAYKAAVDGGRTALLQGGRQYNKYLDDLRKNSPDLYENYIASMDGNHVTPEQWREKAPVGPDGKIDLTTFKMLADRKKQLAKPQSEGGLGKAYDPLYDLPDDQARSVLQLKSTPTGDDIALRNALKKEQWYNDLTAKQKAFYAANPLEGGDFDETERVKTWSALDDAYNSTFSTTNEDGSPAEWTTRYPLVAQQKSLEYGSPESDAFFKSNYDAWKAQSDAYKAEQLALINKMREIEGYPPMSAEQYAQATAFVDTDGDSKSSGKGGRNYGGSSSSRSSVNINKAKIGSDKYSGLGKNYISSPKPVSIKKTANKYGKVKIQRGKSKA